MQNNEDEDMHNKQQKNTSEENGVSINSLLQAITLESQLLINLQQYYSINYSLTADRKAVEVLRESIQEVSNIQQSFMSNNDSNKFNKCFIQSIRDALKFLNIQIEEEFIQGEYERLQLAFQIGKLWNEQREVEILPQNKKEFEQNFTFKIQIQFQKQYDIDCLLISQEEMNMEEFKENCIVVLCAIEIMQLKDCQMDELFAFSQQMMFQSKRFKYFYDTKSRQIIIFISIYYFERNLISLILLAMDQLILLQMALYDYQKFVATGNKSKDRVITQNVKMIEYALACMNDIQEYWEPYI